MKQGMVLFILIVAWLLGAASCGEKGTPAVSTPGTQPQPTPAARAAQGWEGVVAAAQKEGKLMLYGTPIMPARREAIFTAFKERYGIDLEFTTALGPEIAERLSRESRTGLNIADVGMSGPTTIATAIKPLGLLETLEPLLILPEVTDPSKWHGGKLPFHDRERQVASLAWFLSPSLTVNTELVKSGEVKSYDDLLAPKWKGQILLNDPTVGGGGGVWFGFIMTHAMGTEKGVAFMRTLARQEPIVSRDHRQMIEWVAKGKNPLAIGINQEPVNEFLKAGAPVSQPRLKEPFHVTVGSTNVVAFKNSSHPNAKKLFVNWALSKEGNSLISRAYGIASRRVDVPPEGVDPALIPTPQDILLDEDFDKAQSEHQKLAREIFAALLK
ncbi:MAG: extracellular solute-binding protein [Chloroflexi bacterium]|nr:extracellular solute-binding protein [Chloroflexota bacterium]